MKGAPLLFAALSLKETKDLISATLRSLFFPGQVINYNISFVGKNEYK